MHGYRKWNYKVGSAHFINVHRNHPHIDVAVDVMMQPHIKSVIEIGPGEMLEYQRVKCQKELDYTIIDVSDTFIEHCKEKFPEVKRIQSSIETAKIKKRADLVFVSSVLEHVDDISKVMPRIISMADRFHFVMFKWVYDRGGLESKFVTTKLGEKFYSTTFNIHMLLKLIREHGDIEYTKVAVNDTREILDFEEYRKGLSGEDRCGNRLLINGRRK